MLAFDWLTAEGRLFECLNINLGKLTFDTVPTGFQVWLEVLGARLGAGEDAL